MDGWGSLTMLIKRQEAAKYRKANLKYELQKRQKSLLSGKTTQELKFPEISKQEMKILKEEIREKYRKQKIKSRIINIILFTTIVFIFYYIICMKK